MEQLAGFDFVAIDCNKDGAPTSRDGVAQVVHTLQQAGATDVIIMAHGFRNSEAEARSLYGNFLTTFAAHLASGRFPTVQSRHIAMVGVFWPSKQFKEIPELAGAAEGGVLSVSDAEVEDTATAYALEELERFAEEQDDDAADVRAVTTALMATPNDPDLQDQLLATLLARLAPRDDDATEGLDALRTRTGHEVLDALDAPIILPVSHASAEGGTTAFDASGLGGDAGGQPLFIGSLFRSIRGRIGQLLNMGTWYTMKQRAGDVGARTVAPLVQALRGAVNPPRVHLVGHSLGGRVMASAAATIDGHSRVQSVLLLQAAFSHYGFAPQIPQGPSQAHGGAFRRAADPRAVTGPFTATYSARDTVVGYVYAIASRLAGDNFKAIGDASDAYGGIGRNGAQHTPEARSTVLLDAHQDYTLDDTHIVCVDGSAADGITNHSDVTNPRVTNLFAQVMQAT